MWLCKHRNEWNEMKCWEQYRCRQSCTLKCQNLSKILLFRCFESTVKMEGKMETNAQFFIFVTYLVYQCDQVCGKCAIGKIGANCEIGRCCTFMYKQGLLLSPRERVGKSFTHVCLSECLPLFLDGKFWNNWPIDFIFSMWSALWIWSEISAEMREMCAFQLETHAFHFEMHKTADFRSNL